ncbi:GTP 3',8-cyclase MoaA [Helicobacter burdigaliensis]|uniref:GTP 3',8-cyclase MoaA n=1 Tax=Helicobacter burdigaliensis TaxID=2315334 RepID=UPI000EF69C49|nr:GTP 3',8-cyclase MoaA [Helicobacter burdigaliensis]
MLIDSFGRKIDYIRVSITERCNFRCVYCMPNTPMDLGKEEDDVPLKSVLNFIKVAINEGVKKIRITGGEPLLRKGIVDFIAEICAYKSDIDIALTTNAFLLAPIAQDLKNAGLKRINISLDSLQKDKIVCISKRDGLEKILAGIKKAKEVGFIIKLNMVPLKGINENEILEILDYGMNLGVGVRFIEFMENIHAKSGTKGLRAYEILDKIKQKYDYELVEKELFGPATLFKIPKMQDYVFGIIAPHNDDFCKSCNRIRLSSEGKLIPCLYHENALDIKEAMLHADTEEILKNLKLCIENKPEKNDWNEDEVSSRAFYKTGG